ncbi:mitochondrial import inner membrane translocase subunit Tim9-like [Prosopis cineraria]|uniref:mitochondrial import inner membrane translocase subunit Tim9-like n=1 Tax=Prosopis cineraria TaxID=364024 RepID=UPI0024109F98|nr:mitochondrial import inner membrane translocase subunit Tim9-like [Prosopis cineraria]
MMDKSIFGDLDSLSGEDKEKMSARIDQFQARESLRTYNSLVERCFVDCVDTFYRRSLTKKEETCVRRCAEKFLRHSVLLRLSFAELNQGATTTD